MKPNSLIELPLLEILEENDIINFNENYEEKEIKYNDFSSIINFNNLKNLKILRCQIKNFLKLENSPLIKAEVLSKKDTSKDITIKALIKLLDIQTLKEIYLELVQFDNDEISKIKKENYSLSNLIVFPKDNVDIYFFSNLQQKFPNLLRFKILSPDSFEIDYKIERNHREIYSNKALIANNKIEFFFNKNINSIGEAILIIEENKHCKIDTIDISGNICHYNEFICTPYENLKKINIDIKKYLELSFPIFNSENKIIFKSLVSFTFRNELTELDSNFFKKFIIILIICQI